MDLKLDSNNDIVLVNNEIVLVDEYDAIAQHMRIRLRTFLGEWYLDERIGMPYFEEFLVKNPNKIVMQSRIREAMLETPGVISVDSLVFDFNTLDRSLEVTAQVTLDGDTTFNFTFSELIVGD